LDRGADGAVGVRLGRHWVRSDAARSRHYLPATPDVAAGAELGVGVGVGVGGAMVM
jgi:hypothetical protein